jgi:hypothetical protein
MTELDGDDSWVVKDSMSHTPAGPNRERVFRKENGIVSPFSEQEDSPNLKDHSSKGKQIQQQYENMVKHSLSGAAVECQMTSVVEAETVPQSPSLGCPRLPIRTKALYQGQRKVLMDAAVDLGGGKKADVQLVMPEDTAR